MVVPYVVLLGMIAEKLVFGTRIHTTFAMVNSLNINKDDVVNCLFASKFFNMAPVA